MSAVDIPQTKGLEGVVLGDSSITLLDGVQGRMIYRGYNALTLADQIIYEEALALLWDGELPNAAQLKTWQEQLAPLRPVPSEILEMMKRFPVKAHPMDVLRAAVNLLAVYDPETLNDSPKSVRKKALRMVGLMGSIATAWDRIRRGKPVIPPDPTLSHSANFLYTLTGEKPDALSVRALDTYLVLLADHELNASTFTACVVVSTLADIYSAVGGALGTLRGSLHGGANEKAMQMFLEIGEESRVETYIDQAIKDKKKIMGFGHRVYKIEDPRSGPLRDMSRRLAEALHEPRWYGISLKVAEAVTRKKNIYTNVDFFSASVLYMLGIPIDLFTPVFAVARVAGWCAHVFEQMAHNRLIRPCTHYVGPQDRPFVSLAQRP